MAANPNGTRATTTDPIEAHSPQTAPRLTLAPSYTDPKTGAVYVHGDYVQYTHAWEVEQHVGPVDRSERFGDIESLVSYLQTFDPDGDAFITWNPAGIGAILDYIGTDGTPARCRWKAAHPFEVTPQWKAWAALADGKARSQREILESFEDLREDIVAPDDATLIQIMRTMRATVNAKADTELREDGTSAVAFTRDTSVSAGSAKTPLTLPPEIRIAIPVLKGHVTREDQVVMVPGKDGTDEERIIPAGSPVKYGLIVRMRVTVDGDARLQFRLTRPTAERTLEKVYAERVALAKELLGESYTVLRAATGGLRDLD